MQMSTYGAAGGGSMAISKPKNRFMAAQGFLRDNFEELNARISWHDLPALLVPFFLFCVVILPTGLHEDAFLGRLGLILGIVASIGFMLFSRWRSWQLLAFTCLASTFLGWGMGHYGRSKYLYRYLVYERSPAHGDVLPSSSPGGYRDAGYLTFSDDTHVDSTMGLGYRSGKLWCVAPITQGPYVTLPAVAGYWAVGTDCCRERGFFQCGDISTPRSNPGGLVVQDLSAWVDPDHSMYERAARAAAETYGLAMPDRPIFVRWGTEPETVLGDLFDDAGNFALMSVALFALIVPFFVLVFSCLGLALTGRKASPGWNPDAMNEMAFGFNLSRKKFSRQVRSDLMRDRHYWSGEVIYDYAFHVANNHMFLGILFAHPAHPYSKWERLVVCCTVTPMIIFPVAAVSARLGETGMVRNVLVLLAVTIPRNCLKRYLTDVSQADERMELEDGADEQLASIRCREQEATQWEMAVCGLAFIVMVVISFLCTRYVSDHVEGSTTTFILRNSDGLAFAIILEPLIGLILPHMRHHPVTFGFFGRWRAERDVTEEAPQYGKDQGGYSESH